jgi:hypothetical protein
MFDESVSDVDMMNFISKYSNAWDHSPFIGKFVKWVRKCSGDIISNWMYELDSKNDDLNYAHAICDLEQFKKIR